VKKREEREISGQIEVRHYEIDETPSVKLGGVPQCSGEVEHSGTLGTPALFQNSVEWCGMMWNGCALTVPWLCLDNLSPPVTACQP